MRKNTLQFAMLIAPLLLVGCNCLPAGDPPDGAIVEPLTQPKKSYSMANAVNFMVGEFTAICFSKNIPVDAPITINAHNMDSEQLAIMVIRQTQSFIGLYLVNKEAADYTLDSSLTKDASGATSWQLQLKLKDNSLLWEESIILELEQAD